MPGRRAANAAFPLLLLFLFASCAVREVTPAAPMPPRKTVKVALALGAGTAKGFAHVGVLKVLEANRIPVHMIVGTSVGSLVGCMYAYGYPIYEVQKMAMNLERSDVVDLTVPDNGFVKGEKLESYVNRMVRNTPMEQFRIPFFSVATDIRTGREKVFEKGNAGAAVRASCSVPGIFQPMKIGGNTYVDGGLVSPVAVDAARRMGADVVIAVDISGDVDGTVPAGTLDTIFQAVNIMYAKIAADQNSRADVVIRPEVGYIFAGDFTKRHEAILEGEKAAQAAVPKIQAVLGAVNR
jgi:NTE family protein